MLSVGMQGVSAFLFSGQGLPEDPTGTLLINPISQRNTLLIFVLHFPEVVSDD